MTSMDAGDGDQAKTSAPESPEAPAKEDPMEAPGDEGKSVEEGAAEAGAKESGEGSQGGKPEPQESPETKGSDDEAAEEVVTLANLEGPRGATVEAVSAEDKALGQGLDAQTAVLEAALVPAEGQKEPASSPAATDKDAAAAGPSSSPEEEGEDKDKDEGAGEDGEEDAKPDEEDEQEAEPVEEFDKEKWDEENCKYGIVGLIKVFEAMQPMPKSEDASRLKLLIGGGATYAPADDSDAEPSEKPERPARNKGKGKGEKREQQQQQTESKGHYISDMGKTEVKPGSRAGQWWRNCAEGNLDVIVREQFSLFSTEICKIPPGQYVQQGGPCEVFVSGRAMGLQRMPVLPRGWATVDATTVGGPKYLQQVRKPLWKIVYRSGSAKGDIVVREQFSLESPEVAVLTCGARVEQAGALEKLEDGIVRMPINFKQNIAKDPVDGTQPARVSSGWVTCDAVAQGGPKFFEPCTEEEMAQGGGATSSAPKGEGKGPRPHRREGGGGGGGNDGDWDKSRMWKVVNAGGDGERKLAIVTRPEPYAPGRAPPEELFVKWLQEGDRLEQIGHSKKMRGFMVMPVRVIGGAEGEGGWVTRRVVDKARDTPEDVWFVELRNGQEVEPRDRRRANNNRRRDDD